MNSAAAHSAKLIAAFEKQQQQDQQEATPPYPSLHPFGASRPGPFGGAGGADTASNHDAFAANNEMSNFADWDAGHPAGAPAELTHHTEAGPSRASSHLAGYQPRALTQYDYPGGWGAQTFSGVGGLTQDSASRIATLQAKLNQRLGPEFLSQRPGPGGGKKLTYIEGWKLVDLANEVFGFNGWSTTIVRLDVDFFDCSPDGTRFNAGVSCVVRVSLRDGAFHEDIGYGSAENARQKHAALEKGKKEAVTDATKRALKNFGKLLGNCTYDHQYSANALKVSNPPPKFDASELHRRPELRPPPPPAPQPPPPQQQQQQQLPPSNATNPPVPQRASRAAQPAATVNEARPPARASPSTGAQQQALPAANGVSSHTSNASVRDDRDNNMERRGAEDTSKDEVSERQQRSLLARQAYLERQQAEARKAGTAVESHQVVTTANGARRRNLAAAAAEIEFGSDSFDDGLSEVLAGYDETSMGDAEAASRALEMEIDEAQRQHPSAEHDDSADTSSVLPHSYCNIAADDSGVAFPSSETAMLVKQEKVKALEMRRSTSPVKQVKMEAAIAPRRAGSVGRFISPPPQQQQQQQHQPPAASTRSVLKNGGASLAAGSGGYTSGANLMRNGTTSLSAASVGAGASRTAGMNPPSRRMPSTTLNGIGGVVEGAAVSAAVAGRAYGEPVNHGFVAGDAPRGVKRPNELAQAGNGRSVAPPAAANKS
ncbi:related to RAD52-recombination and DNA repair protein [Sporisorium reilianum f. sp. reilianum]|uniref:Related to RAD52-recombination and DNA repair protein n=1 Tax=Sporisorium reilianum f. sp. reilianum TaxID=72559 RepID=A0A2N8UJD1_9BASI|nr:related to RAD52-recombination and DNA repair protein [Sporisorium reilianum f. sp. reilianum]DBA11400.1 TPA_inf: RAD52 [Sporisorium reilianum f. sp. reilianum]